MPTPLTARERAHLKARAHALEPVLAVGHAGVTPQIVAELDRTLTAHELIKVRIGAADRDERRTVAEHLAVTAEAEIVHRVGKVVILWRPRPEPVDR